MVEDRIGQDRIGQDRIGQDRIGQDRIGQDRIGQDIGICRIPSFVSRCLLTRRGENLIVRDDHQAIDQNGRPIEQNRRRIEGEQNRIEQNRIEQNRILPSLFLISCKMTLLVSSFNSASRTSFISGRSFLARSLSQDQIISAIL